MGKNFFKILFSTCVCIIMFQNPTLACKESIIKENYTCQANCHNSYKQLVDILVSLKKEGATN